MLPALWSQSEKELCGFPGAEITQRKTNQATIALLFHHHQVFNPPRAPTGVVGKYPARPSGIFHSIIDSSESVSSFRRHQTGYVNCSSALKMSLRGRTETATAHFSIQEQLDLAVQFGSDQGSAIKVTSSDEILTGETGIHSCRRT